MTAFPQNLGQSIPPQIGILLIGHGTRDEIGQSEFLETSRQLQQTLPDTPVEPCFLELAEPTIACAWRKLARHRVQHVVATPLLLFAAGHAKRDIPDAIRPAANSTADISWSQTDPLGCHNSILQLSARRFDEVTGQSSPQQLAQTLLLMVGRGSLDSEATAAMHNFASLRHRHSRPAQTQVAFIAMAEPRLSAALHETSLADFARVIVQPHLLFAGLLLDEVRSAVAEIARKLPQTSFLVADRLGPDNLLVSAIVDRVVQSINACRENGQPVPPVL